MGRDRYEFRNLKFQTKHFGILYVNEIMFVLENFMWINFINWNVDDVVHVHSVQKQFTFCVPQISRMICESKRMLMLDKKNEIIAAFNDDFEMLKHFSHVLRLISRIWVSRRCAVPPFTTIQRLWAILLSAIIKKYKFNAAIEDWFEIFNVIVHMVLGMMRYLKFQVFILKKKFHQLLNRNKNVAINRN